MTLRVTQRATSMTALANLQASLSRLQQTQDRLSSGNQIQRPSDNPTGTVSVLELRAAKAQADQYGRATDDGIAILNTADSALQGGLTMLQRARSLVVSGLNATSDPSARAAMADEIDQIKSSLVTSANAQYLGRPVFGGTSQQAFDATGAYVGDTGSIQRQIAAGTRVGVSLPGSQAFGSIFTTLDSISADLRSNPTALSGDLTSLDSGMSTMSAGLAEIGSRTNRLQAAQSAAQAASDSATKELSSLQDVDLPKTIMDLQVQQVAYQAALGATAKVIQPSLLDFLK